MATWSVGVAIPLPLGFGCGAVVAMAAEVVTCRVCFTLLIVLDLIPTEEETAVIITGAA